MKPTLQNALTFLAITRYGARAANLVRASQPDDADDLRQRREESLRETERRLREDDLNPQTRAALEERVRRLRELLAEPEAKAATVKPSAAAATAKPAPKPTKAQPTKEQLATACEQLVAQWRVLVAQRSALAKSRRLAPDQFAKLQALRLYLPDSRPTDEPPSPSWKFFADSMKAATDELSKLNPA